MRRSDLRSGLIDAAELPMLSPVAGTLGNSILIWWLRVFRCSAAAACERKGGLSSSHEFSGLNRHSGEIARGMIPCPPVGPDSSATKRRAVGSTSAIRKPVEF